MPPLRTPLDGLIVEVDWDRDTAFAGVNSNITEYVRRIEWTCGLLSRNQTVSPAMNCNITLDNADGFWNFGKGASRIDSLRFGMLVRVRHAEATTTSGLLLLGRVQSLSYSPWSVGERTAVLTLTDWQSEMQQFVYDPAFATNVTTGAAISTMFDAGVAPYPYADRWWLLDVSTLDTNTRIFSAADFKPSNSAGYTTLPYVGDNVDADNSGVNPLAFLEEMSAGEMEGAVLYNPAAARMEWFDRNYWNYTALVNSLPTYLVRYADLLPESVHAMDDGVNVLEVVTYPRSIGVAGSTLFNITSPIRINKGDSRQVVARFRDPLQPNKSCGATTIITPVAGTDYIANSKADGTGSVMTSSVGVSIEQTINSVIFNLSNNDTTSDVFITTLQVRGTPLTASDPLTIRARYAQSISTQGYRRENRTLAATGNIEEVQQFADAYVRRGFSASWQRLVMEVDDSYETYPAGYVLGVLYPSHAGPIYPPRFSLFPPPVIPSRLDVDVLDTAKLADSILRNYRIIGRTNRIDVDAGRWTLELLVEPTDIMNGFVLDFAERATLDTTAFIAF